MGMSALTIAYDEDVMHRPLALCLAVLAAQVGPRAEASGFAQRVVSRAREEVTRGVRYDARYRSIAYPRGDVDPGRGACADVVVRAVRAGGLDLQALVHDDVVLHREAYPEIARPDSSIDHRRVGTLRVWFERHAPKPSSYRAGDVVFFRIGPSGAVTHAGIVSDRLDARGVPLVIHNLGPVAREEDVLGAWTVDAAFRPFPD
jgi:hypothetical protein